MLVFVLSCKGQTGKDGDRDGTTFEEKQQESLKEEKAREKADHRPRSTDLPDMKYAAQKTTPGVVHIRPTIQRPEQPEMDEFYENIPPEFRDFFRFEQPPGQQQPQRSSGSGVIISEDGYIVTNNHVIEGASEIEVILHDNRSYIAEVIGIDPSTDLGLIKIDEEELEFIEFGNSDEVEVGEWVLAVGNPFNLASTVTAGIVSAKARNINILQDEAPIESFIQTDAAVNPGNSGGALVNLDAQLIGINTAIATPTGTYAGYAFAVPVNIVKKVIDDLLNYGTVQRGYLGVYIRSLNAQLAEDLDLDITQGVLVDSVIAESAAAEAGIKHRDVITGLNGNTVESSPELMEYIARQRPGDEIAVEVIRNGDRLEVNAILKNRQGTTSAVEKPEETGILDKLGIEVEDLTGQERDKLNIDGGVKVTGIGDGIIKSTTNMREGFVITHIDRRPVRNARDFLSRLKDSSGGVMVSGVYPGRSGVVYYAFGLD